jgi:hypothetical protein
LSNKLTAGNPVLMSCDASMILSSIDIRVNL